MTLPVTTARGHTPIERLPCAVHDRLCRWVLALSDRATLLHLAISSSCFFAPAIRLAIYEPNPDCVFGAHRPSSAHGGGSMFSWWTRHLGQYWVCAHDDQSDPNATTPSSKAVRLVLPARDAERRLLQPSDWLIVEPLIDRASHLWSLVPILQSQVQHAMVDERILTYGMLLWPNIRRLSVKGAWSPFMFILPRCPDTVSTLVLSWFWATRITILAAVHQSYLAENLSTLVIHMAQITDDSVLCDLYDNLPRNLVTLKLSVVPDAGDLPADLGEGSGVALARNLANRTHLTTFHHDFLHFTNVTPVLEALAAGRTTPMCSVKLGVLFRAMFSLSTDTVIGPPPTQLAVESLDFRLVWRGREAFRADETYIKLLTLLPAPTRALHIRIPEWTTKSASPLSCLLTSPTIQDVQLIATSSLALDPKFYSWFDVNSFALHQIAPTSLVLKRCLPSRLLAKRTDDKWTLPPTITDLDLSENGLTAGDLAFLKPRLPPQLRSLNLSRNKFHRVITPLPESLRVLNVAHTRTLSDALHPERWILALPSKLRELDVSNCGLSSEVGMLLALARERGARRHDGRPRLQIDAGGNQLPENVVLWEE